MLTAPEDLLDADLDLSIPCDGITNGVLCTEEPVVKALFERSCCRSGSFCCAFHRDWISRLQEERVTWMCLTCHANVGRLLRFVPL